MVKKYPISQGRGSSSHAALSTSIRKRANYPQRKLSKLLVQSDFSENGIEKSILFTLILSDNSAEDSNTNLSLSTETISTAEDSKNYAKIYGIDAYFKEFPALRNVDAVSTFLFNIF